ncbi:MAG: SLBB domain-containing protein [Bacteroidota bacterium]|nr:SLBB domain-containing protein [Bacteroidota bacterium]
MVKTILFVLLTTLFCTVQVHAQNSLFDAKDLSNVNIDNYSDADLISFYNKAVESGMSESQLYKIAADRGLPESEIIKLRNRLELLKPNNQPLNKTGVEDNNQQNISHTYDTTGQNIPLQKFKNDETIFGSELFTTNSLVFEPNLRIPAPAGYILGPDDEIIVSVYGFSEKKYDLTVNELGEIYIPSVGPLFVSGLSLEQAGEKIKSKLASTIYRAINSGQTKVQISLGKIRSIRVTVIGQAKKPGTYTVSSLTTLYNILYLCGGPTPMGSYRDIEIIRSNNVKRTADLYDFLVNGNQKDNILLQEGDVVQIPYYKNRVTLSGHVKRPGKYEMLDNETFSDLLKYSGGFTDTAYRGAVTVTRITDTEKKIIDLESSQYGTFKTNGSDEYNVRKLQDEYGNRIFISGSVLRPGPYELDSNMSIKDLIDKAGGLARDAYTKRVSIFRYMKNKMPIIVSLNLDSVINFNKDVKLIKDDSISIHSIFEFNNKYFVTIEGKVRTPGVVNWRENLSLRDVLLSAGGLTEVGDSSNIEISRRIKNVKVDEANHDESEIFKINLADKNGKFNDIYLKPFDIVIVKTLPGYSIQRTVLVTGEVKSPGRYSLQKSGDKISDILSRVGGFKASADSTSITIRRNAQSNLTVDEREKLFQRILNINPDSLARNPSLKDELFKSYDLISVDLATALSNPKSSENLTLEQGDILTINRSSNLVKISGEVYNPTFIPYKKNKNLKYYIEEAGNFTPYARKSGSLVIQPDGRASSVKHFLWFKTYPQVTPRSEIFVPQKVKTNRTKLSVGELALLVSSLGIIVNVLKL